MKNVFFIPVLIFLVGCAHTRESIDDYSQEIYLPQYASGFKIFGRSGSENTLIEVYNPWQGADSVVTRLLIDRDGVDVSSDFDGQVIKGDARRIVTLSSTHIAMLDAVGGASGVVGVSGLDYVMNPDIQARRDEVFDIGYEGNINTELLTALDPDIVLLYGVTGASSVEGKLKELGIPFMYVGDYVEDSPLGKAEWLVALSEVIGLRAYGEKVFAGIPQRYNALKNQVAEMVLDAPSVMLNTPYGDSWFMPPNESYMVRLIKDAGGDYIYKNNTGNSSLPIDLEEAYQLTSQADMWLNVGMINNLDDLKNICPKFTDTRCFKNGYVYNNNFRTNAAGGNDFFESAIVHPDVVLCDLINIFHPGLLPDSSLTYYHILKYRD